MISRAVLFMCFTLLLGVMICLGYLYYQDRYVLFHHTSGVFLLDRNSGNLNFCTPERCRMIQRNHQDKIQFNNFIPVIPESYFKEMLTRSPHTFENAQIAANLEDAPKINPVQDVVPPQAKTQQEEQQIKQDIQQAIKEETAQQEEAATKATQPAAAVAEEENQTEQEPVIDEETISSENNAEEEAAKAEQETQEEELTKDNAAEEVA